MNNIEKYFEYFSNYELHDFDFILGNIDLTNKDELFGITDAALNFSVDKQIQFVLYLIDEYSTLIDNEKNRNIKLFLNQDVFSNHALFITTLIVGEGQCVLGKYDSLSDKFADLVKLRGEINKEHRKRKLLKIGKLI